MGGQRPNEGVSKKNYGATKRIDSEWERFLVVVVVVSAVLDLFVVAVVLVDDDYDHDDVSAQVLGG